MSTVTVFCDVETDGLGPNCRAWEIAIIRRDEYGNEHEQKWFLPLDLRHADPQALRIGGFWDRHPVGRKVSGVEPGPSDVRAVPAVHDVARDIMRLTFGATLVGSGVHFDADVLTRMLRAEGYIPSWSHRLRCVATLASGDKGYDVGGLDGAMAAYGLAIPDRERHTAMGDARAARDIYDAVLGRASAAVAS